MRARCGQRDLDTLHGRRRVRGHHTLSSDGRMLRDLKKVNYVVLGDENAGEHLFM
ncbi:MAG: hypothetical protein H7Z19_07815 [Chitinophagaceae bacterium]|nr:hypothetical protein [Rubrivivax sp.]